jgi:pimeloyl-ACP methyl ester carboxylesterase
MDDRIHHARSTDGTVISGRVVGQGPPLVLMHGGVGDGEVNWLAMAPHLEDRFTCFLMSTRGKGLSEDSPDHSADRVLDDIASFADSIGEPVGLVGQSSGGALSLGAAPRAQNVAALALYEPVAVELRPEEDMVQAIDALERMGRAAEDGRLADGAGIFVDEIGHINDEELADPRLEEWNERWGPSVPTVIRETPELVAFQPTDPSVLERIQEPVQLVYGDRTRPSYRTAIEVFSERLPDARVVELPGVGHLAPQFEPEPVAEAMAPFLSANLADTGAAR